MSNQGTKLFLHCYITRFSLVLFSHPSLISLQILFTQGRPPIQGHVIEVNVECDLRILSPQTSGTSVVIERVPYSQLEPMGPFSNKNKIMSYVEKKSKGLCLGKN